MTYTSYCCNEPVQWTAVPDGSGYFQCSKCEQRCNFYLLDEKMRELLSLLKKQIHNRSGESVYLGTLKLIEDRLAPTT